MAPNARKPLPKSNIELGSGVGSTVPLPILTPVILLVSLRSDSMFFLELNWRFKLNTPDDPKLDASVPLKSVRFSVPV
jgi:hypothetical protein